MKRKTIKKRRTEITVETRRLLIVRQAQQQWCYACAETVMMLTPEDAAVVAGVSAHTIQRRVESGRLHFEEMPDGTLRICLNSLRPETP